jgi:peptide/nickel transport system substrate-binding protein
MKLVRSAATNQARRMRRRPLLYAGAVATAVALVLAGCGGSNSSSPSASSSTTAKSGGTFTILANSAFGVADPAQNYTLEEWQLLINTHDGLTQFARVAGVPGTKIVPDLATSIPTPTNGGARS